MHVDLFFNHYFNFLNVKTDINKNGLNLINPEESKALKRHIPATWLAICLNHSEFDVIWTAFPLFLKLRSHITVLWRFCKISVISEFSFFGYRPQNENPEITRNLYFCVCKVQMHMYLFFDHYFNFLSAKTKIKKTSSI